MESWKGKNYDYAVAMRALVSKFCPGCGKRKIRDIEGICKRCVAQLPAELKTGLDNRKTYPETYHKAVAFLEMLKKQKGS